MYCDVLLLIYVTACTVVVSREGQSNDVGEKYAVFRENIYGVYARIIVDGPAPRTSGKGSHKYA